MHVFNDALKFELETRIRTARESVQRSRLAFLAVNLAAVALLLLIWDFYFSWYRFFAAKPLDPQKDWLKIEIVKSWIHTQWMPTSTLGVNVGVADVSLVGSVLLLVLILWFYFAARRENHTTVRLLSDVVNSTIPEVRRATFWAIADEHIFLTFGRFDRPAGRVLFGPTSSDLVEAPDRIVRSALNLIFFLPVYTMTISWALDALSLFGPSVIRGGSEPLYWTLTKPERVQAIVVLGFAAPLTCFLGYLLVGIRRFNEDTVDVLKKFALRVPEVPDPPAIGTTRRAARPATSSGSN